MINQMKSVLQPGLYLVSTPIGNMGDLSFRGLDILKNASIIACEDTRITGKLLSRHAVDTKMTSYHDHNAARKRPKLLNIIKKGGSVALVSDAGTPAIADPGYRLVNDCIKLNYSVTATPGANAAITALIISGLPTDRFLFAGFLNSKSFQRSKELALLSTVPATLIFYESPRRLATALRDMSTTLGDRPAAIARELTKLHEEVKRGTLSELASYYSTAGPPKGEVVMVIGPPIKKTALSRDTLDQLILKSLKNKSVRDVSAELALETGVPKRKIYMRAIKLAKLIAC